jgi:hypothetical protein
MARPRPRDPLGISSQQVQPELFATVTKNTGAGLDTGRRWVALGHGDAAAPPASAPLPWPMRVPAREPPDSLADVERAERELGSRLHWARAAVARVQGPKLGDASAPLAERTRAFVERCRVFRAQMSGERERECDRGGAP